MPVIKIRRGTTTQWNASSRVLQVGELGIDTTLNRIKAGNGVGVWSALPYLSLSSTEIEELSQDSVAAALAAGTHSNITVTYSDNGNSISLATGPDVITQTSLSNTLTNPTTGYVSIGDVGQADGVASLGSDAKLIDSEIPAEVTRNTAVQTLTNKTIGLGTGITSAAGYDNISGFFGQNNIAIYQAGIDKGGKLNISSQGAITVANSGIGYTSGIATTSGGTRFIITVGGNTLSGTLAEFNAALADGDFATESYVGTAISNLIDTAPTTLNTLNELAAAINDDASFASTVTTALGNKLDSSTASSTYAPIANPTFTGTVGGISKSMVGLGNVDNTTDANKPISTATQTALDLKLNLSEPSVDYYITNSGSGSYTVNGVANGLITFEKGKKYRIHINASGHPFWIQTVSGAYSSGNVYSTGITNGGEDVGHILVELPQNAPDNLYYACQYHSSMQGSISVQSDNTITTNAQSSNYTIAPIDSGRLIEMSGGGTLTITDSASFPVGFTVDVLQTGSSQVTIAGTSFTPNATPGLKLRTQWSSATLIKRGLNSWVVLGDLSA
jgi:hypothetical protein